MAKPESGKKLLAILSKVTRITPYNPLPEGRGLTAQMIKGREFQKAGRVMLGSLGTYSAQVSRTYPARTLCIIIHRKPKSLNYIQGACNTYRSIFRDSESLDLEKASSRPVQESSLFRPSKVKVMQVPLVRSSSNLPPS